MRDAPPLRRAALLGFDVELRSIRTNGRRWPRHWHADLQVIGTVEGRGTAWVDGTTYDLPRGALLTIPPGAVHTADEAGGGWTFLSLHVAPERLTGWMVGAAPQAVSADRPAARAFDALMEGLFAHPAGTLDATWNGLMDHLKSGDSPRADPQTSSGMAEVRRRLEDVSDPSVSVASLAEEQGLGRRTLERAFRQSFHLSPNAWRMIAKVEAAKAAMREGVPVTEAARRAGYGDPRHFSRQYRKMTGITARAFAERFRRDGPSQPSGASALRARSSRYPGVLPPCR